MFWINIYVNITNILPLIQSGPRQTPVRSNANIDVYNSVAEEVLSDSGVVLMDSNIPLSDAYADTCSQHDMNTPNHDRYWFCKDVVHVGYAIIDIYVNMLLNFACNSYLNLEEHFCKWD